MARKLKFKTAGELSLPLVPPPPPPPPGCEESGCPHEGRFGLKAPGWENIRKPSRFFCREHVDEEENRHE